MQRTRRLVGPAVVLLLALVAAPAANATASITSPALDALVTARTPITWANDMPADIVTALRIADSCTPVNSAGAIISQITFLFESNGQTTYENIPSPVVPNIDLNAGTKCAQLIAQHPTGAVPGAAQWVGQFGPILRFRVAPVVRSATATATRIVSGSRHVVSGRVTVKSNLMRARAKVLVRAGTTLVATVPVTQGQWLGAQQEYTGFWTFTVPASRHGARLTAQPQVIGYGATMLGTKRTFTG